MRGLIGLAALLAAPLALGGGAETRTNVFDDPFLQATSGFAQCPVPAGPSWTATEARAEAHSRVERGTSCFRAGRCRLPNAYLYDRELVARVKRFIERTGRFADTSVWITGQRRWIWLDGCVRTRAQAADLAAAVRGVDDVEAVVDRLAIVVDRGAAPPAKPPTRDRSRPRTNGPAGAPP